MAQTTGAMNGAAGELGLSANGSSWTDISGYSSKVDGMPTQNRQTGEVYTLDGDTAIIKAGKREPIDLKINIVYTEGVSEGFETARAAFEAGTPLYVRWSPGGGDSTDFMFTSAAGIVSSLTYPNVAADEAGPLIVGFTLRVPYVTKSVIA